MEVKDGRERMGRRKPCSPKESQKHCVPLRTPAVHLADKLVFKKVTKIVTLEKTSLKMRYKSATLW